MQQQQNSSQGSKQQPPQHGRHSRNNKKKHHATHEAGGHQQQRSRQQQQQSNHNNNPSTSMACKICQQELQDIEKEFFPCNCKYKICQQCFWHHVEHENGKCPNCGLLYEVNRVKEYYATKLSKSQSGQLQGASAKKTRYVSPQPCMTPTASLAQTMPHSTSMQTVATTPMAQTSNHPEMSNTTSARQTQRNNKQAPARPRTGQQQPGGGKQQASARQNMQRDRPATGGAAKPTMAEQSARISATTTDQSKSQKALAIPNPTQESRKLIQKSMTQQIETRPTTKKQRNSSEQQRLQQKLSSVRILQRNTLYVIGLSPNVAKEETLRRYEYFSQYGRIASVTINKEKAFQSENQGLCFSAYINYAAERDASLAILAVDQFVFDGRLLHASFGRTKYCRFFLKGTNCLNHECPYLHKEAHPENILTQEDMNKKILFQQCQQLALKLSKLTTQTEEQFKGALRVHKEGIMRTMKLSHINRIIMPQLESIFEKKGLFKYCLGNTLVPIAQHLQDATSAQQAVPQSLLVQQPQMSQLSASLATSQPLVQPQPQQHINVMQPILKALVAPAQSLSNPLAQQQYAVNTVSSSLPIDFQQSLAAAGHQQQPSGADKQSARETFRQHRGSHGCNSELQSSNHTAMGMMFGGRVRLQSSGALGELDFQQNQNSGPNVVSGQQRSLHQLIPHGSANQNRRFAQDDHYLTRVPAAYRLSTANGGPMVAKNESGHQVQRQVNMTFTNQQNNSSMAFGRLQPQPPRFGSPHPPQNRLYFQQQFMAQQQTQNKQTSLQATRDSDNFTQQSSSQYQTTNFQHVSQVQYIHPQQQQTQHQNGYFQSQLYSQEDLLHHPDNNRARSGSQAATATEHQFEEAKMPERRRKSSHGKFRIFQEPRKESPSPGNKSEQRRFASKLRVALQQFIKGPQDNIGAGDSTGQFSSIFAGGDDGRRFMPMQNKIIFNQNNCSEGVAGGHACSPIRDSILQSRRNSEDYGTLTRPRSQHSLIVESVARILDDTALEQRGGDREKQRQQMTNEPNFKTGPPSEVHQKMYEDGQTLGALNSHFYNDFESKWNNQFNDMASSNSLNLNSTQNPLGALQFNATQKQANQHQQVPHHSQSFQQQMPQTHQQQIQNTTFTSPHGQNGVWHKSSSLYNSPFFLIPTHTQNAQHRSAAYHDHSLRHLHSQSNPFSLSGNPAHGGNFSARGINDHQGGMPQKGMVNDTWRLTYNPHPLLPRTGGGAGAPSSNLSSTGLRFNTTTQSDPEHQYPLLSRTTSQPFMMRSEQKVIQRSNNQQPQNSGGLGGRNSGLNINNGVNMTMTAQRKLNNSQLEFSRSHQIQQVQQQQHQQHQHQHQHVQQQQRKTHHQAQLTQRNLEILNKKYCPSKDMLYAKIFTDYVPSSSPRSKQNNTTNNQVNSFGGHAPQHPISVQNYKITPQSLFCFALDGDDSNDLRHSSTAKLRSKGYGLNIQKQVSRDDANLRIEKINPGILSTPTRRKEPSLFFNSSYNLDKVKETSMTPTNKHSRAIATNWNDYVGASNAAQDTRSLKQQDGGRRSGLMPHERYQDPISAEELEMANQLANEASLGFNDLFPSMMHHSKSKKSQYDAPYAGTRMSAVDGECQPQRSRSQSYRDRMPPAGQSSSQAMFAEEESERKQRRDNIGGSPVSNHRMDNSCDRSDSSLEQKRNTLGMNNQQASQGPSVATATTTGGQKNFYQEFVKVQEGFRKSSGLISSSGFGATKVETRRSSYSQGRNCSNKTAIQLMDVTRRGSYKQGNSLRRSQIISPLGLLKFKNHQIDEVNEDGVTERDEKIENKQDPMSVRMNSADRQSYNLKTLKSVSRSRKASHSQNGNNFD